MKNCPICNRKLICEDKIGNRVFDVSDWICPLSFRIKGDPTKFHHYRESPDWSTVTMIAYPYRIITEDGVSKIGKRSRYKTGAKKFFFKTVAICPALHPDTEEKLLNRIKLILVMS